MTTTAYYRIDHQALAALSPRRRMAALADIGERAEAEAKTARAFLVAEEMRQVTRARGERGAQRRVADQLKLSFQRISQLHAHYQQHLVPPRRDDVRRYTLGLFTPAQTPTGMPIEATLLGHLDRYGMSLDEDTRQWLDEAAEPGDTVRVVADSSEWPAHAYPNAIHHVTVTAPYHVERHGDLHGYDGTVHDALALLDELGYPKRLGMTGEQVHRTLSDGLGMGLPLLDLDDHITPGRLKQAIEHLDYLLAQDDHTDHD